MSSTLNKTLHTRQHKCRDWDSLPPFASPPLRLLPLITSLINLGQSSRTTCRMLHATHQIAELPVGFQVGNTVVCQFTKVWDDGESLVRGDAGK